MVNNDDNIFTRIANDVLQSAEQIATRMEEGISVLLTGKLPNDDSVVDSESKSFTNINRNEQNHDFDEVDDFNNEEDDVEDMMLNNPLQGMAEQVLGNIMSSQAKPETPWQHFQAFKSAINWKEPFVVSIIVFQIIMFVATLWVSRRGRGLTPRITIMVVIASIVRSAEYVNKICSQHWKKFATQDYFDRKGIFILIMICLPLLLDSFIMLLAFLREASSLLIEVKTKQIRKELNNKKKMKEKTNRKTDDKDSSHKKKE